MGDPADRLSARLAAWLGYYATMFVGPLLAVARTAIAADAIPHRRRMRVLERSADEHSSLGAFGVLIFGSVYAWGFLLLFAGVAIASVNRRVLPDTASASNVASPA